MPDQEVHEIQLNGKQLVFMFMAATVVSVVIFLCGVMVGRGVQPQAEAIAASPETAIDPTAPSHAQSSPPPLSAEAAAAPVEEHLTYSHRLEAPVPGDEPPKPAEPKLKPAEPKPTVAPAVDDKKAAPRVVPAQDTKPQTAPKAPAAERVSATKPDAVTAGSRVVEPPGDGFVLQVRVFPTREAAETLRQRLAGKGYMAFITLNPDVTKAKYRVRVGKFATKAEADAVAVRLRQEHFDPWLTH